MSPPSLSPESVELVWNALSFLSLAFFRKFKYTSWMFLFLHVDNCSSLKDCRCSMRLSSHHEPTVVACYTIRGPCCALKLNLRCHQCIPNVNYGYSMYGNKTEGYKFYEEPRPFIEASNCTYLSDYLLSCPSF